MAGIFEVCGSELSGLFQDPACGAHFASLCFVLVFLPVTLGVYWSLPNGRLRILWLALASAAFYSLYDLRFLTLIYISALVDYGLALGLERVSHRWRPGLLAASLTFNLGVLALFKYSVFAAETGVSLWNLFGTDVQMPGWKIVLPVGISFYTFQTISYTADVYRRTIPAERDLLRYLTYVSMFPQLVAGPIVRYSEVREQFQRLPRRLPRTMFATGLVLFAVGLFKKAGIADTLAVTVDGLWLHAGSLHAVDAVAAVLGFGMQILFDFSGYSDMALGLGALMGFNLPVNFFAPYRARSPSDFWRRWHITLSRFLRDYLYIPLGGNNGRWLAIRNVVLVMALGGLWHGAAWTFVLWGLLHGGYLAAYHVFRRRWDALPSAWGIMITGLLVQLAWVFFRAPDVETAVLLFGDLTDFSGIVTSQVTFWLALAGATFTALVVRPAVSWRIRPSATWGVVAALLIIVSLFLLSRGTMGFIYYAF